MRAALVLLLCLGAAVGAGQPAEAASFRGLVAAAAGVLPEAARTSGCRRRLQEYSEALSNHTLWAVAMADASAKLGSGLLSAPWQLGAFDQCVGLARGRYCLATVTVRVPRGQSTCEGHDHSECSGWQLVRAPRHRLERRRDTFRWALCLPTDCGHDDARAVASAALRRLLLEDRVVSFNVSITPRDCHAEGVEGANEDDVSRPAPPLLLVALAVYGALLVVCTLRHWDSHGDSCGGPWTAALSAGAAWRRLVAARPRGQLGCLDGLRAISAALVVFGHRADAHAAGPLTDADAVETLYDGLVDATLMNGHLIVDTFFTISGLLAALKLCAVWDSGLRPSLLRIYAYRYLRVTPAYAVVLLFQLFGLYGLASGPLWRRKVGSEVDNCRRNLLANLAFVSNYVGADTPCLEPSWYLSVDVQLWASAPLLLLALRRWGRAPGVATLLAASAVPAAVTYARGLDPTFMPDPSTLGHNAQSRTYLEAYVPTHCRAAAFVVGLFCGCWLHRLRGTATHIADALQPSWLSLPLGALASLAAVCSGWLLYRPGVALPPWAAAAYAGLHRPLYAAGIALIIAACATGRAGPVGALLSYPVFLVPSRLTYCLFLTHSVAQMVHYASVRAPVSLTHVHVVWLAAGDYVVSLLLALLLHLLVEAPLFALARHALGGAAVEDRQVPQELLSKDKKQKSSFGRLWLTDSLGSKAIRCFLQEPFVFLSKKIKNS